MNNVLEVQDQTERFSLSMRDWMLFQMVNSLITTLMETDGVDFDTAYKSARALVDCVSVAPAINVVTGKEGGVVIEHNDGMFTLIGVLDIGAGSKPTARVILGKHRPRIQIG